jgi:hypothetical protein
MCLCRKARNTEIYRLLKERQTDVFTVYHKLRGIEFRQKGQFRSPSLFLQKKRQNWTYLVKIL